MPFQIKPIREFLVRPSVPAALARMPEPGNLDRRRAASLAGRAPHPRDSGSYKGRRFATGGGRSLRPPLSLGAIMRHIIVIANARLKQYQNRTQTLT